jgi:O-antigen/teichoic acid export membrane protein
VAKISYALIPLILFYYFKIDPYYLVLITGIIIIVCFFNKLKLHNSSFRSLNIESKQIEYAWPIGLNTFLRTFISYFDQIVFLVILTQLDLSDYTKLIKLSMGFRLAFTLPHVRLLPLYLVDFRNKSKLFKLKKFYNYYIILILTVLTFTSKYIINIFSIPEEFIYLTLVLIISESIRASSSFMQLYYSAINKTINNLYGNLLALIVVITLFYPSYTYYGLNGLVFIQFISSLSLILYHSWKVIKIKKQSVL